MAADVADDEVEQAVAVPIRDRDGGSAASEGHQPLLRAPVNLTVIFHVIAILVLFEFAVAGDGDPVRGFANASPDIDEVAVSIANLFRWAE
jgi:hypothetical protein